MPPTLLFSPQTFHLLKLLTPNSLFQPSHVHVYLEIRKDSGVGQDATHTLTRSVGLYLSLKNYCSPVHPASASSQSIFHHLTSWSFNHPTGRWGEPLEQPERGGVKALGVGKGTRWGSQDPSFFFYHNWFLESNHALSSLSPPSLETAPLPTVHWRITFASLLSLSLNTTFTVKLPGHGWETQESEKKEMIGERGSLCPRDFYYLFEE